MITVRTACLNKREIEEMYDILVVAHNRLCVDGGANCKTCLYKKICNNLVNVLKYLETAPSGR